MVTEERSFESTLVIGIRVPTGFAKRRENLSTNPIPSATRIRPLKKQMEPPIFNNKDTVSAGEDNIDAEIFSKFPVIIPQTVPQKINKKQIQPIKFLSPFLKF